MVSDKLSVGELMTTQMTALEPVMLISKLEGVLKRCAHQAFPVTNEVDKAFAASESLQHVLLEVQACHVGTTADIVPMHLEIQEALRH